MQPPKWIRFVIAFLLLLNQPSVAGPIRPAPEHPAPLTARINDQDEIRVRLRERFIVLSDPSAVGDSLYFKSFAFDKSGAASRASSPDTVQPPLRISQLSRIQFRRGWSGEGAVFGGLIGLALGGVIGGAISVSTHERGTFEGLFAFLRDMMAGSLIGAVSLGVIASGVRSHQWKTVHSATPDSLAR